MLGLDGNPENRFPTDAAHFFTGRSSKQKNAKYQSIDSQEGKPSLLSTSSETSSESEVSSDEDSGDPSGEFRISR